MRPSSALAVVVAGLASLAAALAASVLVHNYLRRSSAGDRALRRWTLATHACLWVALVLGVATTVAPLADRMLFSRLGGLRVAGDVVHGLSFVLLFWKLLFTRSAEGLSLRTLQLYLLVFCCRYIDVMWSCVPGNMYNCSAKVLMVAQVSLAVLVVRCGWPHRRSHCALDDTFPACCLLPPAALVALASGPPFDAFELSWRLSLCLEAVAIVPQLHLLRRRRGCEALVGHFIFTLGTYRLLYLGNWVWRAATEEGYWNPFVWGCGAVQGVRSARAPGPNSPRRSSS